MKEMIIEMLKKNKELLLGIIVGLLFTSTAAYAATIFFASSEVSYDDSKVTGTLGASTVKEALDKLYEREEICNTVTITYNKGSCTTASNVPSTQTTRKGTSITLQSGEPTCSDNKVFLGWSTTNSATQTSTWYDPNTSYNGANNLTLYAQWYDVSSLESSYTTFVQSGDFHQEGVSTGTWNASIGQYASHTFTPPSVSGYSRSFMSGWSSSDNLRFFRMESTSAGSLAMKAQNSNGINQRFIYVKDRTATTYQTDTVDTRIDRLQKLQDVDLSYSSDIATTVDSYTVTLAAKAAVTKYTAVPTGFSRIAGIGYYINPGTNEWYLGVPTFYSGNIRLQNYSISNTASNARVNAKWFDVRNKTARTTTYSPNTHSTKGLSRYVALKNLNDAKDNYFTYSDIKTYCRSASNLKATQAWGAVAMQGYISIPNGRLLGPVYYMSSSAYGFAVENYLYTGTMTNGAKATQTYQELLLTMRAGNTNWNTDAGQVYNATTTKTCVLYISRGTPTYTPKS